jgi:photosystem II stability/assembly factor-like uncharacterized protein
MQLKKAFLVLPLFVSLAFAQWHPQKSNTDASLHGLSIVNGNIFWVSGTGGTFVRTTDGGETWQAGRVAGAEKLDFRDVHAIDGETAYLMSIGKGNESRIYKTTDAGKNWLLEYTEQNPKAFLDCMAFWDATHGIVVGDPLDSKPELLTTSDGGAHWTPLQSNTIPPAKNGEGSPASGTCIATYAGGEREKGKLAGVVRDRKRITRLPHRRFRQDVDRLRDAARHRPEPRRLLDRRHGCRPAGDRRETMIIRRR